MNRRLVTFSGCAAAAYLLLILSGIGGVAAIAIKPLAVLALALGAWRARVPLLAAALVIHAAGDVAIELGGILVGIGPFLAGHLLYLVVLWPLLPRTNDLQLSGGAFWRRLLVAGLAGWAGFLVSLLLPHLTGPLVPAVPVYAAALLAMASTATLARVAPLTVLGAVLYVASDSLLAIDAFVSPVSWRDLGVWPTYAVGQILLASGIIAALQAPSSTDDRSA